MPFSIISKIIFTIQGVTIVILFFCLFYINTSQPMLKNETLSIEAENTLQVLDKQHHQLNLSNKSIEEFQLEFITDNQLRNTFREYSFNQNINTTSSSETKKENQRFPHKKTNSLPKPKDSTSGTRFATHPAQNYEQYLN
ncbi:hypothetical protein [Aliikangiella maris]|uniref:Uncharacterized protein n=2 Tax=Aliikangiella maris TaxID=3162458 RepID=A0ABV2BUK8_9GAMM